MAGPDDMINRNTVLVLGAGASADYGFPTGRKLRIDICEQLAGKRAGPLRSQLTDYGISQPDFRKFSEALHRSGMPSVDAFLENKSKYMDIGKAAIAASLIPYERPESLLGELELKWYEYLFQRLGTSLEEFQTHKLSIVTFNYDRSLEYFLFTAIRNSYVGTDEAAIALLKTIPIIHVYGQLGKPAFLGEDGRSYSPDVNRNSITACLDELQIISEANKRTRRGLSEAKGHLTSAELIAFLGFGYYGPNVRRLTSSYPYDCEHAYGTAYEQGETERARHKNTLEESGFFRRTITMGNSNQNVLPFLQNAPVFP